MSIINDHEDSGYMRRKEKAMFADCVARFKDANIQPKTEKEAWMFAHGYMHGRRAEHWHSIDILGFADSVANFFKAHPIES